MFQISTLLCSHTVFSAQIHTMESVDHLVILDASGPGQPQILLAVCQRKLLAVVSHLNHKTTCSSSSVRTNVKQVATIAPSRGRRTIQTSSSPKKQSADVQISDSTFTLDED